MVCQAPVHGIVQARVLKGVALSSSRVSFQPRIKPTSPASPALQVDSLPPEASGKLYCSIVGLQKNDTQNNLVSLAIFMFSCYYDHV